MTKSREKHEPTKQTRGIVKRLVAFLPHDQIGHILDIDSKTLRKHYKKELESGKAHVDAAVGNFIVQQATQDKIMAMFYAKCRMNWRETNRLEHTGKDGTPLVPVIKEA